jgi:flagellar basal body P-ring formation protein FlgA
LHQWGYGQEVSPTDQATQASDLPGQETFVPSASVSTPAGNLELQREATVSGPDVTLKQICRWSDSDAATFTPIADLTVLHLPNQVSFRTITVDDIRQTLHDSGVNIVSINFTGVASCAITRSDAQTTAQQQTVGQWIDSQQPTPAAPPASATAAPQTPVAVADPTFHTLRELLTTDLSQRLNIDSQVLQLTFSPADDKVLSLAEPLFKFDVGSRARALGNISWQVTIFANSSSKKIFINAVARQWEDQVIVARPVAAHQIFAAEDFATHRVLVDSLPERQLLRMDQCIGEQAAEDLAPGTIMTAPLVNAVPLIRAGQLVTVTLTHGTVQLRSVARAMEQGTRGQTIRVRNENSRDVLYVVVTGPQAAEMDQSADSSTEGDNASVSQAN